MSYLCDGKQKFESYEQAEAVRKRCRASKEGKARVYKCNECGSFHIGTTIKRNIAYKSKHNHIRGYAI